MCAPCDCSGGNEFLHYRKVHSMCLMSSLRGQYIPKSTASAQYMPRKLEKGEMSAYPPKGA